MITPIVLGRGERNVICGKYFAIESTADLMWIVWVVGIHDAFFMLLFTVFCALSFVLVCCQQSDFDVPDRAHEALGSV